MEIFCFRLRNAAVQAEKNTSERRKLNFDFPLIMHAVRRLAFFQGGIETEKDILVKNRNADKAMKRVVAKKNTNVYLEAVEVPRTRGVKLKKLGMPNWQAYRNGNTR